MATMKEAVSTLLKNGAKRVDNLIVNNVTITVLEKYTRVALTLDSPVEGYNRQEDATYERGETNVIFVSLFSIAAMLRENDEMAFAVNDIVASPKSLQVLFSRAKISILQEEVVAGEVRTNPYTGEVDERALDHDTIFNHVIEVKLSKIGQVALEKMMDKMLAI